MFSFLSYLLTRSFFLPFFLLFACPITVKRESRSSTARIIELIQNARKVAAQFHRQFNNISDAEAKVAAKPISVPDEHFCDATNNFGQKM